MEGRSWRRPPRPRAARATSRGAASWSPACREWGPPTAGQNKIGDPSWKVRSVWRTSAVRWPYMSGDWGGVTSPSPSGLAGPTWKGFRGASRERARRCSGGVACEGRTCLSAGRLNYEISAEPLHGIVLNQWAVLRHASAALRAVCPATSGTGRGLVGVAWMQLEGQIRY